MKTIKEELEQLIWTIEEGMTTVKQVGLYLKRIMGRIEGDSNPFDKIPDETITKGL